MGRKYLSVCLKVVLIKCIIITSKICIMQDGECKILVSSMAAVSSFHCNVSVNSRVQVACQGNELKADSLQSAIREKQNKQTKN